MALLEVAGIGKSFGSTAVLRDISFDLQKGEALAIIGSSGSGKTTLLRCLNFLETADTGSITVAGETLWSADDARTQSEAVLRKKRLHFGLVFQNFNLFPQYTALQNVMLAGELLAKERPDYKRAGSACPGTAGPDGAFRPSGALPAPAFRRAAAARGHCPRPGPAAGHPLL